MGILESNCQKVKEIFIKQENSTKLHMYKGIPITQTAALSSEKQKHYITEEKRILWIILKENKNFLTDR